MAISIKDDIVTELDKLPEAKLAEVLDFVRGKKALPKGFSPNLLREYVGAISKEDLNIMEKVIEQECRRIDYENW